MELAKAYPHLQFIIQDLGSTVEQGKKVMKLSDNLIRRNVWSDTLLLQKWDEDYPEAVTKQRVEFKEIDFLKEAPVEGCEIYYVRSVSVGSRFLLLTWIW